MVSLFSATTTAKDFETYIYAVADAMRDTRPLRKPASWFNSIVPISAWAAIQYADLDLKAFHNASVCMSGLNHATKNIPPAQLSLAPVLGQLRGPHHYDVPLADIIDVVFSRGRMPSRSKPPIAPRPRYTVFETVKLPPGKC